MCARTITRRRANPLPVSANSEQGRVEAEHILTRLFEEGSQQVELGNFELAIEAFSQARAVSRELGDLPMEGLMTCLLASCFGRANMASEQGRAVVEATTIVRQLQEAGEEQEAIDLIEQIDQARRAGPPFDQELGRLLEEGSIASEHGDHERALEQFGRALDRARSTGERRGEAVALTNMGTAYSDQGSWDEAVQALRPALVLHESMDNLVGQAHCHVSLAITLEAIRQFDEALKHGQSAYAIARELGDGVLEATARNALGNTARSLGRMEESIEHYEAALALYTDQQNRANIGKTLFNLGDVYASAGRPQDAIAFLEKAIPALEAAGNYQGEALAENSLAMTVRSLGQPEEALRHLHTGLAIARAINDLPAAGVIGNNLGSVYRSLGLLDASYEQYERAQQIAETIGDPHAQGAVANNIGLTLERMGRVSEAVDSHRRAAAIAGHLQMPAIECVALVNAAALYLRLPDGGQAFEAATGGLAAARRIGDRRNEAIALNALGLASLLIGQPNQALDYLLAALGLSQSCGFDAGRATILQNLAVSQRALGRNQEALAYYRDALQLLESLRGQIFSDDLRSAFFSTVADLPAEYADLLVQEGEPRQALEVVERGRARGFVDLISESSAEIRQGIEPDLRLRSGKILSELRVVRDRLQVVQTTGGQDSRREIDELGSRKARLELDQRLVEGEIRRRNPRFGLIASPEPWSVERIQGELLHPNSVLLEYSLGQTSSLLFAVTANDFGVFRLSGRAEIELMVSDLRAAVLARRSSFPHGHALYRMLLEPAAHLIGDRDIVVVPDGALHYLPFALLLTEDTDGMSQDFAELPYLIRRRAVSYTQSATVAGLLAQLSPDDRPFEGTLAAYADPIIDRPEASAFDATDQRGVFRVRSRTPPRIPDTATEVWLLASLCADIDAHEQTESFDDLGIRIRTGHAATKSDVLQLTAGGKSYRFLHFATHGLLDTSNPLFSGLAFSSAKGSDDSFWRTFEIFNAQIQSEFVVLSACETGLGRLLIGEGVIGLTRAFIYAGARAISVSLWKVADASTPYFMEVLYREILAGTPKPQAVRAAQLQMIKGRYAHPVYWAPFILVGEAN